MVILDRIHPTLPADPSPCGTVWVPVIQVALCLGIPVPSEAGVEHVHELLDRNPGLAAAVEELYLQPPEEAL